MLSPSSLATLFASQKARLVRLARKRFGPQDSEDDLQTAFLNVITRQPSNVISPESFIARSVVNAGRDRIRVRQNNLAPDCPDEVGGSLAPWIAPDQETALLLKQVILALPPIYRDTFVLNRFMGLTYAEIAQRQGITVKAVEYRMSRALALCQEALRD